MVTRLLDRLPLVKRWTRVTALALAAWSAFACVYVMFGRLFYPFELEWMSGSILDHVERVQRHEPIYVAPTSSWIPFLYPPLYYWAAAFVARALPLVAACRSISIASTLAQAACIYWLTRRHGAPRFWAAIAVGAFFAAYRIADFWYDIERPDSLFLAMVLVASVMLIASRGVVGAVGAGLLMGLAFFAKQPTALFLAGAIVGLARRREWVRAVAFGAAAAAVLLPLLLHLEAETGGWFGYYVLRMPRAHGMSSSLVPAFLLDLRGAWVWALATAVLVAAYVRGRFAAREDAIFVCLLAASFGASMTSRLHVGGWSNVLSFWTSFGAVAIGVIGSRAEEKATALGGAWRLAIPLPAFVAALQLYGCTYWPADHVPRRATVTEWRELVDRVHGLEATGDVIAVGRGHLTTARHFHMAALIDVITVEHEIPEEILRAFRERRFSALVIDAFEDLWIPLHPELDGELFRVVSANYYVAERLDERIPGCILGWPARPSWVLLPRELPLEEKDRLLLERRSLAELQVAAMREAAERRGTTFPARTGADTTEVVARELCDRVFSGAVDPVAQGSDGGRR